MEAGEPMSANPELEKLNEIAVKVGRMEATQEAQTRSIGEMASSINRLVDRLEKSDDIAREALEKVKSAHLRINDTNKEITGLRGDVTWLWRTVIGAIITGFIGGAIIFFWKGIGG